MITHAPTTKSPYGIQSNNASSLTARMKEKTNEIHKIAENRPFMLKLRKGDFEDKTYQQHLSNLQAIYNALEAGLTKNILLNSLTPLNIKSIFRLEAIENDLKRFRKMEPTFEAKEYTNHLQWISDYHPHRLIGHAYTRYLGDLFGGQEIYKNVVKSYGEEYTKLYQFQEAFKEFNVDKPLEMGMLYREILNKLELSPGQQDEVVEEALMAFKLSDKVIENS